MLIKIRLLETNPPFSGLCKLITSSWTPWSSSPWSQTDWWTLSSDPFDPPNTSGRKMSLWAFFAYLFAEPTFLKMATKTQVIGLWRSEKMELSVWRSRAGWYDSRLNCQPVRRIPMVFRRFSNLSGKNPFPKCSVACKVCEKLIPFWDQCGPESRLRMMHCWLWKWLFQRTCSVLQETPCSSFWFWHRPENK